MITEQWSYWSPLDDLPKRFFIKSVVASQTTFEIVIRADDAYDYPLKEPLRRRMRIFFQMPVVFYKNVHEYCSLEDVFVLQEKYGDAFVIGSALFQVRNSNYLQWLTEESKESIKDLQLKHFVFFLDSSRIDIITTEEPLVGWIDHAD